MAFRFGWRRKTDGFDWHTYVRTTIKVRRAERRQKVDDVRHAAAGQAIAAGQAVAAGSKAAGVAAAAGAKVGVAAARQGLGAFLLWCEWRLVRALAPVWSKLSHGGSALMSHFARPAIAMPLAVAGLVAAAAGVWRWTTVALDAETMAPLVIGALLLLAVAPALLQRVGIKLPALPKALAAPSPRLGLALFFLVLAGGGAVLYSKFAGPAGLGRGGNLGTLASLNVLPGSGRTIEGRGTALSGDTLRIDGKLIRLAGIEAPDRQQACTRGGKKWSCGEAARAALERTVKGRPLRCKETAAADVAGRIAASCSADGKDIAEGLVKDGFVFSTSTLIGGYASAERAARSANTGLWAGESERPSDYRTKLWDAARQAAPEGCPIKGHITSAGKVYLLPWSPDYGRMGVRASRGERWFCSEEEAVAAGWKALEKG